jgi:hypothetical protein
MLSTESMKAKGHVDCSSGMARKNTGDHGSYGYRRNEHAANNTVSTLAMPFLRLWDPSVAGWLALAQLAMPCT